MGSTLGTTRVVGGSDVMPGTGSWAGIASIRMFWNPPVSVHVCGGTLVNSQWLLTAAHCFINATNEWAIVFGATSLGQSGPDVEVRRIKRLIMHEKYVPDVEYNDVAMVELDKPVRCRSTIQTACLPAPSVNLAGLKDCYIAGWGDRIVKCDSLEAKVQFVPNQLCNSSEWLGGYIYDFHVCAGQGGVGTCQVGASGWHLLANWYHQLGSRLCQTQTAFSLQRHSVLLQLDLENNGKEASTKYSSTNTSSNLHRSPPGDSFKANATLSIST
uniref:Peptidase S1 domain-containing protein n=1 Tax=Serinus canaria TaxID=9135 RepID=A0A8C9NGT0_SERCA